MFSFRYGGFSLGMPLPSDLKLDLKEVPKNRTLSKVNTPPTHCFFVSLWHDSYDVITES